MAFYDLFDPARTQVPYRDPLMPAPDMSGSMAGFWGNPVNRMALLNAIAGGLSTMGSQPYGRAGFGNAIGAGFSGGMQGLMTGNQLQSIAEQERLKRAALALDESQLAQTGSYQGRMAGVAEQNAATQERFRQDEAAIAQGRNELEQKRIELERERNTILRGQIGAEKKMSPMDQWAYGQMLSGQKRNEALQAMQLEAETTTDPVRKKQLMFQIDLASRYPNMDLRALAGMQPPAEQPGFFSRMFSGTPRPSTEPGLIAPQPSGIGQLEQKAVEAAGKTLFGGTPTGVIKTDNGERILKGGTYLTLGGVRYTVGPYLGKGVWELRGPNGIRRQYRADRMTE